MLGIIPLFVLAQIILLDTLKPARWRAVFLSLVDIRPVPDREPLEVQEPTRRWRWAATLIVVITIVAIAVTPLTEVDSTLPDTAVWLTTWSVVAIGAGAAFH